MRESDCLSLKGVSPKPLQDVCAQGPHSVDLVRKTQISFYRPPCCFALSCICALVRMWLDRSRKRLCQSF